MVLTWRVCVWNKRERGGGGLIHLIPSCHCGRGCMYCRAGCRGNCCRVRESFFPPSYPPPPPPPLLFFCPVPQYLVRFLPPSLLLFPSLQLVQTWFAEFLGGECSGMRSHTHTHNLSVCLLVEQTLGNNESQKETFFQEDLELRHRK